MRTFVLDKPSSSTLRALNYSPEIERIRRKGSSSARQLHTIVKEIGPAYGTVFTRLDCNQGYGVELITQGDMFAAEPVGRMIRLDSMHHPERHLVTRNQVLISGAGTLGDNELYGRSILADGRLVGKYVGPHSMSLRFEDPDDDFSLFTYAWLACPTGTRAIRSTSYGTKILGLRKDLLSSLPVPNADSSIVRRVASLVRTCSERREVFLHDLKRARKLVEQLPEMQEAHAMCAERKRRAVVWSGPFPTLSAWTFASTAGALGFLRTRWDRRLADVVETSGVFRGGRGSRIPCAAPHGVEFLSQRDAFLIRPIPQRVLLPSPGLIPRPGTIMVGGQGTLGEGELFGRSVLVPEDGTDRAWTEHLLRILPQKGHEATLFAFLTTTVGFRLMRSCAVGTKLLSLRPDLLLDLPIPSLPTDASNRINRLIRESLAAKAAADASEAEALRIVEQDVLPQWLA